METFSTFACPKECTRCEPTGICTNTPLSFERHGRWARQTISITKKLAFARAVALGLEPSEETKRWYAVIACTIQKTNARILRGEPVPAAAPSPPNRWFSGSRDLGLVGRSVFRPFPRLGLGCINADFCVQGRIFQRFSSSTFVSFAPFQISLIFQDLCTIFNMI